MIRIYETPPDLIKMEISLHIPQTEIFEILQKKGYEIKAFPIHYEGTSEMLIDEPPLTWNTFTATKKGEEQNRENQFLIVLEREIKESLNLL